MGDPTKPPQGAPFEPENLAQTLKRELPTPIALSNPDGGGVQSFGVPAGWTVKEIDNEKLLPNPRRTKALATLNDAPSFIDFVNRYAENDTTVWASFNPQGFHLDFSAVIDEHGSALPGWRDHKGVFRPDMSAEWKVWLASNGPARAMEQTAFAEFLEANEPDIRSIDGSPSSTQMMAMALDFEAKSEMRFAKKVSLTSGNVVLEFKDAENEETTVRMSFFKSFAIAIPVFWRAPAAPDEAVPAWPIHARLKYRVVGPKVLFWYELVRPDLVYQTAASALIAEIKANVRNVPLVMGNST